MEVDGHRLEGFWRSHQVPLADVKSNPEHLRLLETWLRSFKPEELFDDTGKVRPEIVEVAPSGRHRMSASPHANAELRKTLRLPDFRDYGIKIDLPGNIEVENVPPLGRFLRDVMKWNMNGLLPGPGDFDDRVGKHPPGEWGGSEGSSMELPDRLRDSSLVLGKTSPMDSVRA